MRRVLVTGASRGIGHAIALGLARMGFSVVVHAHAHRVHAQETAIECAKLAGLKAEDPLLFDVADRELARTVLERDINLHGAFWGVVVNAGVMADAPFPAMSPDLWDRVIDVDLTGFYNVLRPLALPMVSLHDGGRIVAVSSASALTGNRGQVNYAAAKAGLIGAVKSLALELAKRRITVNAVAPGLIETQMLSSLDEAQLTQVRKQIPMRRFGLPDEVAGAVCYLFGEQSAYVTRQVISVNGGLC